MQKLMGRFFIDAVCAFLASSDFRLLKDAEGLRKQIMGEPRQERGLVMSAPIDDWTCECCRFTEKRAGATRMWIGGYVRGHWRIMCGAACADQLRAML